MTSTLTKDQIIAALSLLNEKLGKRAVVGEACIFGGAAMVLAFNARLNTRDVDAVFMPKEAMAIVERFFAPSLILPRTQFFAEEVLAELNPNITNSQT